MKLTKDQRRVLAILYKGGDLICAKPGGWWLNDEKGDDAGKADGRTCQFLLRHCLVKVMDDTDKSYVLFEISEDGKNVFTDPKAEPQIDKMLTKEQKLFQAAWRY